MSNNKNAAWIETVANELGIENLDRKLVTELEHSIKNEIQLIIQDSIKFARHSYRKTLLASDIQCTLNMKNSPPIIGCNYGHTSFYDPNEGKDSKNEQQRTSVSKANSNIMIKEDRFMTLHDLQHQSPPHKPGPISVIVSWLAIDGKVLGQAAKRKDLLSRIPKISTKHRPHKIEIAPIQCHDISKEQQLFFEVLRNTVVKGDSATLSVFLDILQHSDAGLARLVPRIVCFIAQSVKDNVNSPEMIDLHFLLGLMRIAEALVLSRYLCCYLENYLQQFMPPILTCCMKENLSVSPTENHWNLRTKSAHIVQLVLDHFGKKFPMVRTKVIKTLIMYFKDFTKTFKTHYGAIMAMKCLGIEALEFGLLPNVEQYVKIKLKPAMDGRGQQGQGLRQNVIRQQEAKMVLGVILESLWICAQHQKGTSEQDFGKPENQIIVRIYSELRSLFGEAMLPFNMTPPECEELFI